ncbi:hypothetical protein HPT25_26270 [Bacillus sp. BRMEA1]|uniref:hypothetical protein n=1 Tax=Neobacillus endophyticus TaxID=2738405 RepID=UPI001564B0B9|nr:hypothetical protein [Neobacillus endophyticus]NRD80837.1 hypothetical protein [Neobacillus endophyticus]
MQKQVFLYSCLPYLIYGVSFLLAAVAGILVYVGLTSKQERIQNRLRIRKNLNKNKERLVQNAKLTKAEELLKKAHYPLGLNGMRYYMLFGSFVLFLLFMYVFIPLVEQGGMTKMIMTAIIIILLFVVLFFPLIPFSLFVFIMKKVVDYHQTKKNVEVFMLYDLLINEIEMMSIHRINTYNIVRNILPYFDILQKPLTSLLSAWSSEEGPKAGLDKFAEELGSKESLALIGVMKNLDDLDRNTALEQLKGMHQMFVKAQIENYRRRWKVKTDLLGIPIKTTHFVIILNFLVVIVTMVSIILEASHKSG